MKQDKFERFYLLIISTLKHIQKLKNYGMMPYGLTSAHTMCLRYLYRAPEGLTRTKLVRLCDIDKAQVSRIINELCAKGYVEETHTESANYRKRLKLTPIGRDITVEINAMVAKVVKYTSGDIPPQQMATFYETFEHICERLKEAEALFEIAEKE